MIKLFSYVIIKVNITNASLNYLSSQDFRLSDLLTYIVLGIKNFTIFSALKMTTLTNLVLVGNECHECEWSDEQLLVRFFIIRSQQVSLNNYYHKIPPGFSVIDRYMRNCLYNYYRL